MEQDKVTCHFSNSEPKPQPVRVRCEEMRIALFRAYLHPKHALLVVMFERDEAYVRTGTWCGANIRTPDSPANLDGAEWGLWGVMSKLGRNCITLDTLVVSGIEC